MNKLMITVMTALLLAASGIGYAKDFKPGANPKGERHHPGSPPDPMDRFIDSVRRLDLSDDQKEFVWSTMHTLKGDIHAVERDSRNSRQQLKDLVMAETYDKKAVAALARQEGDRAAQRIILTSEAMSRVLAQLTKEQRTELETMKADRALRAKDKRRGKHPRPPMPPMEQELTPQEG